VLGTKQLGEIRLGRQYPAQINPFIDTFAGVTGFSPWASLSSMGKDHGAGASVGDSRISNAVSYSTPATWTLGGMAQAAFRESSASGAPTLSAYGIEMHYTIDDWYFQAQAMYNNTNPSASVPSFRDGWYGFAVKKELPSVTAAYIFNALRPEHDGYPNSQTHALSLTIPVGLRTIRISPVYRHVAGTRDLDSFAIGLGYDYNLSKRTALYARLGYIANRAKAAATLGAIPPGDPGDDLSTVAIGVRVRF
jgi:predicted porin